MEILSLGSKIKNRRKELNLTLKDLAGERVTPAQLSYVETDKCRPSLDLLEFIANRLELEMDYLLESEKKQVSRFCEYNIRMSQIDIKLGRFDEARSKLEKVEEASHTYEIYQFYGEAEQNIGKLSYRLGNYNEAGDHYLNALHIFSKLDDAHKIIEIYIDIALNLYAKKEYKSAVLYLVQSEGFLEDVYNTSRELVIKVYYYLMTVHAALKDRSNALAYGEKLSEELKFVFDGNKYLSVIFHTAEGYGEQARYDRALEVLNSPIGLFSNVDDIGFIGKVETNLGIIYTINGMIEESFNHLYRAIDIKRAIKDSTIPLTLLALAENYLIKRDFEKAFEVINEALNISITYGIRDYEILVYKMLFKVFSEKGDFIKAEESIRRCSDILEGMDDYKAMAECYLEMGEFYRKLNREKEAYGVIVKSLESYKKGFNGSNS